MEIRGELVQLNEAYREVLSQTRYSPETAVLLGQFMAASALLSATLKFNGNLILQVKTSGRMQLLMAECRNQKFLRAIARCDDDSPDRELLGEGQLAITIEPERGERYQGIISFDGGDLGIALQDYFSQSEQLRTRLWLNADGNTAAGMLIQELPRASELEQIQHVEDWSRVCLLADTVTASEMFELDPLDLLRRLFHEEQVRIFEAQALAFKCTCSTQRTSQVLLNLGQQEVRSLSAGQGTINIDCQFCHRLAH